MKWKPLALLAIIVLIFTPLGTVNAQNAQVVYSIPNYYHFQPPTGYDVFWSQTIYSDNPSYTVGTGTCNCINFTNASFNPDQSPAQTFGIGLLNTNETLSCLTAYQVCTHIDTINSNGTAYLYYYYSGSTEPSQVSSFGFVTQSEFYYTNYTNWQVASDPAVYNSGSYLLYKTQVPNVDVSWGFNNQNACLGITGLVNSNVNTLQLGPLIVFALIIGMIFAVFFLAYKTNVLKNFNITNLLPDRIMLIPVILVALMMFSIFAYQIGNVGSTMLAC